MTDEVARNRRADRRAAGQHLPDGFADADSGVVLEQVTGRARLDRRHHLQLIAEHRDDHDQHCGPAPRGFANDVETVAVGQSQVDQQHGRARNFERRANLAAGADGSRDLQARLRLGDAAHERLCA